MHAITFSGLFAEVDWLSFVVSVFIVSAVGAIWHSSILFGEIWKKTNKADKKQQGNLHAIAVIILQLITTAVMGLVYFIATQISMWLSFLVLIAIAGWEMSDLSFRIWEPKAYLKAVLVGVGYFCLTSLIFIFFATLR